MVPLVVIADLRNGSGCETLNKILGWYLSRSGNATIAASALEHALIGRFGTLGKVPQEFHLRSDNGLIFTLRRYTALVRSYGLKQEFITPHCPQHNVKVERMIRTLKEQCVHRQRFDSIQYATRDTRHATRDTRYRRLDQLLQQPPTSSGSCHAHACRNIQISGLT